MLWLRCLFVLIAAVARSSVARPGVTDSGYRKSGSGSINSMVVRQRPTTARRGVQQTDLRYDGEEGVAVCGEQCSRSARRERDQCRVR